jgi:hypothetical protein
MDTGQGPAHTWCVRYHVQWFWVSHLQPRPADTEIGYCICLNLSLNAARRTLVGLILILVMIPYEIPMPPLRRGKWKSVASSHPCARSRLVVSLPVSLPPCRFASSGAPIFRFSGSDLRFDHYASHPVAHSCEAAFMRGRIQLLKWSTRRGQVQCMRTHPQCTLLQHTSTNLVTDMDGRMDGWNEEDCDFDEFMNSHHDSYKDGRVRYRSVPEKANELDDICYETSAI